MISVHHVLLPSPTYPVNMSRHWLQKKRGLRHVINSEQKRDFWFSFKILGDGFLFFFICFYGFAVNVTAHSQIFLYLNVYTNKYYFTCVSLSLSLHACLLGTLTHPSLHIYRPPSLYAHLADFRGRLSRFYFRGTDRLCLSVRTSGTFVSCLFFSCPSLCL